jgi:hypothetical protein
MFINCILDSQKVVPDTEELETDEAFITPEALLSLTGEIMNEAMNLGDEAHTLAMAQVPGAVDNTEFCKCEFN